MPIDIDKSFYDTGTATVSQGGTAVTGQGTAWLQSVRPGDLFGTHKGYGVRIASVNSNTSLTLAHQWPGPSQTAQPYEIQFTPYDVGYQQAVRELLQALASGNVEALAALTGNADELPYFTGQGTMALTDLTEFARTLLDDDDEDTARATIDAAKAASVSSKTANYTVTADDDCSCILVSASGGARTVTLPAAASAGSGFKVVIKKTDSSANTVTIDGNGSETIDGAATKVLRLQNQSVALICDGTGWRVMAEGSVFESGSNANGEYVRFADGTQICWRDGATATMMAATTMLFNWTLPASFSDDKYMSHFVLQAQNFSGDKRQGLSMERATDKTNSYTQVGFLGPGFWVAEDAATGTAFATGRWF